MSTPTTAGETAHTPEPWGVSYGCIMDRNCVTVAQHPASDNPWDDGTKWYANRDRIVACVNNCKGLNPEAVPDMLGILRNIGVALEYPRGSEAQIRCLEEIAQDAKYIIRKAEGGCDE